MTVNEVLVLMRAIRDRVSGLEKLRSQVAVKERWYSSAEVNKQNEPQYDVKDVDRKITTLQAWLFKADAAVKQANATTQVSVEANVEDLLAPLS